ncbi:MAG: hypothetical protein Sylvanvirus5_19 [Sylvanvirus sp.]|uniref:Collagen-like protein n=1 Tax=Sylvanvirus sp. TaxID=2487774 RepID=A0A3G5AJK3_9VIRU|nr:MAG: hypothetical protein Sylvanvirus5_19 [Sylvanvirus sp.]
MGKQLKPKSKRSKRSERIQIIETVIPEEQCQPCQPCQPMPICEEPNECDRLVCIRGRPGKDGRDGNEGERGKRGKRGKIGPIGPVGGPGGPGMMGIPGMNGLPGPSGPAGIGLIGPQGIGSIGPVGPAGRDGGIGPVGPSGMSIIGPAGKDGGIGPIGPSSGLSSFGQVYAIGAQIYSPGPALGTVNFNHIGPFLNSNVGATGIQVTSSGIYDVYFMIIATGVSPAPPPFVATAYFVQLYVNESPTDREITIDAAPASANGSLAFVFPELSLDTLMTLNALDTLSLVLGTIFGGGTIQTGANGVNALLKVMKIA